MGTTALQSGWDAFEAGEWATARGRFEAAVKEAAFAGIDRRSGPDVVVAERPDGSRRGPHRCLRRISPSR